MPDLRSAKSWASDVEKRRSSPSFLCKLFPKPRLAPRLRAGRAALGVPLSFFLLKQTHQQLFPHSLNCIHLSPGELLWVGGLSCSGTKGRGHPSSLLGAGSSRRARDGGAVSQERLFRNLFLQWLLSSRLSSD